MTVRLTQVQRGLIESNRGLAETISHDFLARAPGLDLEEVVAVAYQGLVTAALRYDSSTNVPFGAWASKMIKFEVLMWQRKEDYLDRGIRADFKKLVEAGHGTPANPPIEILAQRTGLKPKRISTVLRAEGSKPTSTDIYDDSDDFLISSEVNVESSALVGSLQGSVVAVIKNLPMLQQVVLALHYFEGTELRIIAQQLETSVSVVRAAHSEAVLAVHEEMVRQARQHD